MLASLSRFTELRQLHFTLWEDDKDYYDAQWWTAEMVRRLPDSCHAAVSVEVLLHKYSASCGPIRSVTTIAHARHAILREATVAYAGGD